MRRSICGAVLLFMFYSLSAQQPFFEGSWEEAFIQAEEQNKLILVDFYASWCVPCRVMDETVFQNETILAEMNMNYISLKMDVDDFDASEKAEQYNIQQIPTVLIFDSEENLLSQLWGLQTESSFLKELKKRAKKTLE